MVADVLTKGAGPLFAEAGASNNFDLGDRMRDPRVLDRVGQVLGRFNLWVSRRLNGSRFEAS